MKATLKIYIAVIGPGIASESISRLAGEVGAVVAAAGAILVTGGLGGVMEAASRGARQAGGMTVGIVPGTSREGANPYLDVCIPTAMGEGRNALVVRAADGVIALGGGEGTLSELALAVKMNRPVVGLNTWQARYDGLALPVPNAGSAAEAVGAVLEAIGRQTGAR